MTITVTDKRPTKRPKVKQQETLTPQDLIRRRIPAWDVVGFLGDDWATTRRTLVARGGGSGGAGQDWTCTTKTGLEHSYGVGSDKVVVMSLTWVQVRDLIRAAHPARVHRLAEAGRKVSEKHSTFPIFKAPPEAVGCGFPRSGEPLTEKQQIMEDARKAHEPLREQWDAEMKALRDEQDLAYKTLWDQVQTIVIDGVERPLYL